MRLLRNHLITVFSLVTPEMLIQRLRKRPEEVFVPDRLMYQHYSAERLKNLTFEEIDGVYSDFEKTVEKRGSFCGGKNVFALLPEFTLHTLGIEYNYPVCKQDRHLSWRTAYLQLGQDLFTTAHLAYLSATENRIFTRFDWKSVINDDDQRLSEILRKGLAENHFHLNGSTRSFDLSWLCLMNHPTHIKSFFPSKADAKSERQLNESFEENLYTGISSGVTDNIIGWQGRLLLACWLRANLFFRIRTGAFFSVHDHYGCKCFGSSIMSDLFYLYDSIGYYSSFKLNDIIAAVKLTCGNTIKFKQPNGSGKCIDYAITSNILSLDSPCRSLMGERVLMYNALRMIYSDGISQREQRDFANLFYLYILIKTNFRREMIQANGRYGFKNFAKYQDRKDIIFDRFSEYNLEAKNLSINEGIKNCNVSSLEARLTPKDTCCAQCRKIYETDRSVLFLQDKKNLEKGKINRDIAKEWFYVMHFPKFPDSLKSLRSGKKLPFCNHPRNSDVRKTSKKQAKAMAMAFEKHNWLCARIRGIDACTFEIGCRPEVFATEFRFLRGFVLANGTETGRLGTNTLRPDLHATYHVGEDFEDIIDGLRAIDEAVTFLEFCPGERLGHAMALGVDVRKYYDLKKHWIILKKQDYLDNIVWALTKSKMLNISLNSALKQRLYDKASELIEEIYQTNIQICDYYNSWQLRGDDPYLYRFGYFDEEGYKSRFMYKANNMTAQYCRSRILSYHHPQKYKALRSNNKLAKLYSRYHFDSEVKERGSHRESIHISDDDVRMAEVLQAGMRQELAQKRIGIECNPSSNVLIGPFELYRQHPIFTFYPPKGESRIAQFVSVNTDDQGVFDTSLEEEFALLRSAMFSMKNDDLTSLYTVDEIYNYLNRLRMNGFTQSFLR